MSVGDDGDRASHQLGREMLPLALQLREFASSRTGEEALPAVRRLVPLAAEIVLLVASALRTSGDPDTGKRNLLMLRQQATKLAQITEAALREAQP